MSLPAYEIGKKTYPWWPAWEGQCVAIVASGMSTKQAGVEALRDRIHVIAIKTNYDLCPWADIVYGCDAPWWIDRKGLPEFKGLKIAHGPETIRFPDIKRCTIEKDDRIFIEKPLTIGNGGNSGFQALNLAVQFGAKDIILIGYDFNAAGGDLHWYGRNKALGMNNPSPSNFQRWLRGFDSIRKDVQAFGLTVINTSEISSIPHFRKAKLADILKEWGL
jgi:hypothetical protein